MRFRENKCPARTIQEWCKASGLCLDFVRTSVAEGLRVPAGFWQMLSILFTP